MPIEPACEFDQRRIAPAADIGQDSGDDRIDVLITVDGHENLTAAVPKDPDDVEAREQVMRWILRAE